MNVSEFKNGRSFDIEMQLYHDRVHSYIEDVDFIQTAFEGFNEENRLFWPIAREFRLWEGR